MKTRVRYAYKGCQIEAALEELAKKNQHFISLIDLSKPGQWSAQKPVLDLTTKRVLGNFSQVKETAKDLYEALGNAALREPGTYADRGKKGSGSAGAGRF